MNAPDFPTDAARPVAPVTALSGTSFRPLNDDWTEMYGRLQETEALPADDGGVLVRLTPEDGPGGWILPLSDLAGTAVMGHLARSAHAPAGILGITGLRGGVFTVVDARYALIGRLWPVPRDGWLTLLSARWGGGWALLWPEMVGLRPSSGWRAETPGPEQPDWVSRCWYDEAGDLWRELNTERWVAHWSAPFADPAHPPLFRTLAP